MTHEEIKAKVREFVRNEENLMEAVALMQVGTSNGDQPLEIMKRVLANTLLRFHDITLNPPKLGQS